MSLILEALRKLEREKQTPERGLLVVGAAQWPKPSGVRAPLGLFLLGLAFGAVLLGVLRWRGGDAPVGPPPAEPRQPALAAPPPATRPPQPAAVQAAAPKPSPPEVQPSPAATSPAPAPAPSTPVFALQAISERDGRPVAIVNERMVREGDSIDGALIVKIGVAQVEIEVAGRRVVLKF